MKRLPIYIILLLLVLITAVFARINADSVEIDFYFTTAQAPLALWLYISLVLGAVTGILVSLVMVFRTKREMRRLRKRLTLCEQEVKNLRELPLKDQF